jgi:hypothetical protein
MKTTRLRSMRATLLAILIALLPSPAPTRADPGRFLVIYDDPFERGTPFDRLQGQPVGVCSAVLRYDSACA